MSVDTAPAAMPGEEEIARVLHRRHGIWYEGPCAETDSQRRCREDARAILALFDKILAEKERLVGCLKRANANHEEFERRYYLESDRSEAAEARALAAEAALAGEREASLGVGGGGGQLFVHGSYEAIAAVRKLLEDRQ